MAEPVRSRRTELIFVIVIAVAIAAGGRSLLFSLSHNALIAGLWIAALAAFLLTGVRRRRSLGASPVVLTRDVTFVVAALLSIVYIASPARWSSGATIAALEFALILEMLTLVLPAQSEA